MGLAPGNDVERQGRLMSVRMPYGPDDCLTFGEVGRDVNRAPKKWGKGGGPGKGVN